MRLLVNVAPVSFRWPGVQSPQAYPTPRMVGGRYVVVGGGCELGVARVDDWGSAVVCLDGDFGWRLVPPAPLAGSRPMFSLASIGVSLAVDGGARVPAGFVYGGDVEVDLSDYVESCSGGGLWVAYSPVTLPAPLHSTSGRVRVGGASLSAPSPAEVEAAAESLSVPPSLLHPSSYRLGSSRWYLAPGSLVECEGDCLDAGLLPVCI